MSTFRKGQIVVYREFIYSPEIPDTWSFETKDSAIEAHREKGAQSYVKLGKINGGIYRSRVKNPHEITINGVMDGDIINSTSPSSEKGMGGVEGDLAALEILPDNESSTVEIALGDTGNPNIWNPSIDDILLLTSVKNLLETQYPRRKKTRGGTNKNIKRHKNSRYKKSKRS